MKTKNYLRQRRKKHTFQITTIFAMVVFFMLTLDVNGAEIEGVHFEDSYETQGLHLELQGTGLLRYLGAIRVYVGALYLEEGVSLKDVLSDRPKRLEVEYFHAIKKEDFGTAPNRLILKNTDSQILQKIRPQIEYHNSLYEDVQPGDRYSLTYIPGRGTELALNGKTTGVVKGADFASALFSIWLGEFPINKHFRRQLLGLK